MLGLSRRGAENLVRRLREHHYIVQHGKGRARRIKLQFRVEQHTKCGDHPNNVRGAETLIQCVDKKEREATVSPDIQPQFPALKDEQPLADDLDETLKLIDRMCHNPGTHPETIVRVYERILKRFESEAPEATSLIQELTVRRDAFFALSAAFRLPKKYHQKLD